MSDGNETGIPVGGDGGGGGGCAPFIPKNSAVISQIPDFLAVLP